MRLSYKDMHSIFDDNNSKNPVKELYVGTPTRIMLPSCVRDTDFPNGVEFPYEDVIGSTTPHCVPFSSRIATAPLTAPSTRVFYAPFSDIDPCNPTSSLSVVPSKDPI